MSNIVPLWIGSKSRDSFRVQVPSPVLTSSKAPSTTSRPAVSSNRLPRMTTSRTPTLTKSSKDR